MNRLGADSKLSRRQHRLSMSSVPGGVVGEHHELDSMTGSHDALSEDASAELDVIVMAADERESQHSPYRSSQLNRIWVMFPSAVATQTDDSATARPTGELVNTAVPVTGALGCVEMR